MVEKAGTLLVETVPANPKQRILAAAYREFIEKGLDGARTRDIARAARVNIAMVHYYFGSKGELYEKVVHPAFASLGTRLKTALKSRRDSAKRVEALVDAYFDFLKEHPDFPRLVMWEGLSGGETLTRAFQAHFREEDTGLPQKITELFQHAQADGVFTHHPPVQAVISLVALCVFPLTSPEAIDTVFRVSTTDEKFIEERRQHVKDLLIRGLSVHRRGASDQ